MKAERIVGMLPTAAMREEETLLKQVLSDLEREYRELAQPYIERLTRLELHRPVTFVMVPETADEQREGADNG